MSPKKFRVYNKSLGRFVSSDEWFVSLDGKLMFFSIGDGIPLSSDKADRLIECKSENYIIQQFTGLIDKNGREIYEGDIVKTDLNHITLLLRADSCADYNKGEIRWLCHSWKVCGEPGACYAGDYSTCDCCPCGLEVIGSNWKYNRKSRFN